MMDSGLTTSQKNGPVWSLVSYPSLVVIRCGCATREAVSYEAGETVYIWPDTLMGLAIIVTISPFLASKVGPHMASTYNILSQ